MICDIASEAGISPGALYNYVEGKDALFHVLFEERNFEGQPLPVPNPPAGATAALVRSRLAQAGALSKLRAALHTDRTDDVRAELAGVIEERYVFQSRNWRLFALVEKSAVDLPALKELYFHKGRRRVTSGMARYLESRMATAQMRRMDDPSMVSRIIEEAITWFAWHRRGDPDSAEIDDAHALAALVQTFTSALVDS